LFLSDGLISFLVCAQVPSVGRQPFKGVAREATYFFFKLKKETSKETCARGVEGPQTTLSHCHIAMKRAGSFSLFWWRGFF